MRKNFGAKPILYPQPVFIIATYNEDGTPNAMNAAWGGVSEENQVSICVSAGHKTTENILARKAFTVSMGTEDYAAECDYVGLVSGSKQPDKVSRAGFHVTPSEFVDAPLIDELPMDVECRLISYNQETEILVGEVVNVCADESVLTDGKIDPKKLKPLVFDGVHHTYRSLGDTVAKAFSAGLKFR